MDRDYRGANSLHLAPPLYGFTPVGRDLVVYGVAPATTVQVDVSGRSGTHARGKPYATDGVSGKRFAVRLGRRPRR